MLFPAHSNSVCLLCLNRQLNNKCRAMAFTRIYFNLAAMGLHNCLNQDLSDYWDLWDIG